MKVKDLIGRLKKENPDRLVVCQSDAEGNGYSPLSCCWTGAYKNGEVGLESLDLAAIRAGYTEEDVLGGVPALFLAPV